MREYVAHLKSVSPYSQGRRITSEKLDTETDDEKEKRTWRERMHTTDSGHVLIPGCAFKRAIEDAAKYRSMPVPGKGKATFTKHFLAGVIIPESIELPDLAKEVVGEWHDVPSNGQRGGGRRVLRCFPVIQKWEGDLQIIVLDETIVEPVLLSHLADAGRFIGIGVWRAQVGGLNGRFEVVSLKEV